MKKIRDRKRLIMIFAVILSSVSLMDCREKEKVEKNSYKTSPKRQLDSLESWFSDYKNFNNKDFLPKFYSYFNKRVKAQQWESAAQLLRWTGYNSVLNEKTDSTLIQTSIRFLNSYANYISNDSKSGIYNNIGELFYYDSNFKLAEFYLLKSTKVPTTDGSTLSNIADAYKTLSYLYAEYTQYDKALENNIKALDIASKLQDNHSIGNTYDARGYIYFCLNDFENANQCFNNAIKYLTKAENKNGVFATYINKVALYQGLKDEKLLPFIDTIYQLYQTNKALNTSYAQYAKSWYSYKLLKEGNIAQAENLLKEIVPEFEQSNEKKLYSTFLYVVSLHNEKTGRPLLNSSIFHALVSDYKKRDDYLMLASCYDFLKYDALRKKDYKTAFFYEQAYNTANDSIYKKTVVLKTKEIDKKYQTEKKEQFIKLQNAKLKQNTTLIYALLISIFSLIFLIIAYYLWQRQKTLKKEKARSMNFTKQLLENTEDERKRIASDLHDSVSHELLNLKSMLKGDFTELNAKIDKIINDIRGISRNLHPVMFDKIGLQPNIEQLVERLAIHNNFLVNTNINYKRSLSSADELHIFRIIQEALTNIIKYANAHAAKITIEDTTDKFFIEIRDNGKGFNVKETLNSHYAFGLHNIIERSRVIGGKATIKSSGEGTIIAINISKNMPKR